jgi:DNA-binding protein YbaB
MAGWLETREKAHAQYRRFATTFRETAEKASVERLRYRSPDGLVTVVVDGSGNVRSITIAPGTLRGAHPERLAASVMNAVNAAGKAANKRLSRVLRENLEEAR